MSTVGNSQASNFHRVEEKYARGPNVDVDVVVFVIKYGTNE